MKIADNTLKNDDCTVYAIGSIIHNDQAMKKLTEKGLIIEEDLDKMKEKSSAIIRSHGLSKAFYDKMTDKGITIVDATCPFVKKIQDIVFENSNKGYEVIIIGDKTHPEIIGISGWSQIQPSIIHTEEEAYNFQNIRDKEYIAVVQTTFKYEVFSRIENILKSKIPNIIFFNTICYATKQRQESAEKLSRKTDVMIVIGGKKSSNTLKLAEICKRNCKTLLIETYEELDLNEIKDLNYIGIVAGASTPDFIINQVYDYIVNKIKI